MTENSLLYWYPKICELAIPTPKTQIVLLNNREKDEYAHGGGDSCSLGNLTARVAQTIEKFTLPVFLRTDLVSNKWMWENSCYLEDLNDLQSHLFELISFNMLADMMGLPLEAIVVREALCLHSKFKAFAGMPVSCERRYFIRNRKVECHHPYWPEDAFLDKYHRLPLPENWKALLADLNKESDDEISLLSSYAIQVSRILPEYWSIDFAKTVSNQWYLIDMALGGQSWHPACSVHQQAPQPLPDGQMGKI